MLVIWDSRGVRSMGRRRVWAVLLTLSVALGGWVGIPAAAALPLPLPGAPGMVLTASAGTQAYPTSLALLPDGNLAWADSFWGQVGILDTSTLQSTAFGLSGIQPNDLAVDAEGDLWVIGLGGELVEIPMDRFGPEGALVRARTRSFGSDAQPTIAIAADGTVFWSDTNNNWVWSYDPSTGQSPAQYSVEFQNYYGQLVATPANTIMVASSINPSALDQTWTQIDVDSGAVSYGLWSAAGSRTAVVGGDGRVWAAGSDRLGDFMTWFDPEDGGSGQVRVDFAALPTSMAVDGQGRIWWMSLTGSGQTPTYAFESFDASAGTVTDYPVAPGFPGGGWHAMAATSNGLVWSAGGRSGRFTAMTTPTDVPVVPCTPGGLVPVGTPVDCTEAFGGVPATMTGTWFLDGVAVPTPADQPPTPTLAQDGQSLTADLTVTFDALPLPQQVSIAGTIEQTTVTGFAPTSGPADGGTEVTFSGTGFYPGQQVYLDGVLAPTTGLVTDTTLTVTVPPRPRPLLGATAPPDGAFTLVYPDREQSPIAGTFTYVPGTAPQIDAFTPVRVVAGDAAPFTITGVDLVPGTIVTFTGGGRTAPATDIAAAGTSLTGLMPTGLPVGSADVSIRTPSGDTATLAAAVTIAGPPSPVSLSPSTGSATGGGTVTITGSGFLPGASVMFGSRLGLVPSVVSEQTITVEAPPQPAGPVEVVVANPGFDPVAVPGAYTYVTSPTVDSVTPSTGPTTGGTDVVITGSGFVDGAEVQVSGGGSTADATDVDVVSLSEIHATLPEFEPGLADVTVTTTYGTGTLTGAFTYDPSPTPPSPPVVTAVSPNVGPPTGGTDVAVTGSGYIDDRCVLSIGGVPASQQQVVASTRITGQAPAGQPGAVDVTVTCPNSGSGTLPNGFTYQGAPTVSSVSPWSGDASGGTAITISGLGFASSATVSVGGAEAASVVVEDATTITAVTPPGTPGFVTVSVTNPGYPPADLANAFAYLSSPTPTPSPTVTPTPTPSPTDTPTPTPSPTDTPTPTPSPTVTPTPTPSPSPAPTPAPSPPPPVSQPTVTAISPNEGSVAGGESLTVTGSGFRPGVTVTIGGAAASSVEWVASTTLTLVTPAGAPGAADVRLTNPDGGTDMVDNGYTYESLPVIGTITPSEAPVLGDTPITITGAGFAADATVEIGGLEAQDVTVVDGSTIRLLTPVGHRGPADVTVTNPHVGATVAPGAITYVLLRQRLTAPLVLPKRIPSATWTTILPRLVTTAGQQVSDPARCIPRAACRVREVAGRVQVRVAPGPAFVTIDLRLRAPARLPLGYDAMTIHTRVSPRVDGGNR